MAQANEAYDSAPDTLDHIGKVQANVAQVVGQLEARAQRHDLSKLNEPEKAIFDACTPRLRSLTYGSEEYQESLADLGIALTHHYEHNSHHPEHHPAGVAGMTLLDVVEMLADWRAATERHADGDIRRSIAVNTERFGLSPQLAAILRNTVDELGW